MEVEVTKMQLSDLEQIKQRLVEDFGDFWTVRTLQEELENKSRFRFLLHNCKTKSRSYRLCRNIKNYR